MTAAVTARWKPILAGQTAEVLFSALPLVVMIMVLHQAHHDEVLWASPEWSFGAAILFGQIVIRFVNALIGAGIRALTGPVALTLAMVVVIGLAPSLTVLTMTLQAVEASVPVDLWLQLVQVCLFLLSAVTYLLLGTVGEVLAKSRVASAAIREAAD
jgi:hypothetical protein